MRNMGDREEKPRSFAGSLLVAHPNMLDPNFRRAVLFLSAHDADGALGLIINRPLDKSVADVVNEATPEALAGIPVFLGGPVGNNQLILAAFEWHKGEKLKLNHNVDVEQAKLRSANNDSMPVRAFVGYAGWGAGQLDAELKQKAWIIHKASRAALKPERLPRLWFDIMRTLGPWYKMLAAAPDDPSLN
jgi:putative transcriptional regulator